MNISYDKGVNKSRNIAILLFLCLLYSPFLGAYGYEQENKSVFITSFINISKPKHATKAFEYFLAKELLFIKNINVISNTNNLAQKDWKDAFVIKGRYKIEKDNIALQLSLFYQNAVIEKLYLSSSVKQFSTLLQKIIGKIAPIIVKTLGDKNSLFEEESLNNYTLYNKKTLHQANLFMTSHKLFAQEDYKKAILYAKKMPQNDIDALFIVANSYLNLGSLQNALYYYKVLFRLTKVQKLRRNFSLSALSIAQIKEASSGQGLGLYKKILNLNEKAKDFNIQALCYLKLAILHMSTGNYNKANIHYYKALELYKLMGNQKGEANTRRLIAKLLYRQGEYNKALSMLNRAISINKKTASYKQLFEDKLLLADIISIYLANKDSEKIYKDAIKLIPALNISYAKVLIKIALVNEIYGNTTLALEYMHKALEIYKQQGHVKGIANSYSELGQIHYNKRQLKKALYYFENSLLLNTKNSQMAGIAKDYSSIGLLYSKTKNYTKALYYYNKALKIRQNINDSLGIAITKNSLALVYLEKDKDFDRAIKIYKQSILTMQRINYKEGVALSYWMLGLMYTKKAMFKKAINYYIKSKRLFIELNSPNYKNIAALIDDLKYKLEQTELEQTTPEQNRAESSEIEENKVEKNKIREDAL